MAKASGLSPDALTSYNRSSRKLSLDSLKGQMKRDPESYESELLLLRKQFNAAVELLASLNLSSPAGIASDPTVAVNLGDLAKFLAHVTLFYPKQLADFPHQLIDLLSKSSRRMPPKLRYRIVQSLIHLMNQKIVDIEEVLLLFMEIQTLGDKNLQELAFSRVVRSIGNMNLKRSNQVKDRNLQLQLLSLLQQGKNEAEAKRALVTLCELNKKKVWSDGRVAEAICMACLHDSTSIKKPALMYVLGYENHEDDHDSDDASSSDLEEESRKRVQVVINREAVYKAHKKGTAPSKKRNKRKLQRANRSMKRQQRRSSSENTVSSCSPLNHLNDAQGFAKKLFSRLKKCTAGFEIKVMMMKVIARTVGLHLVCLEKFYPYLQIYAQPNQRYITDILAAAVQSFHEKVSPTAVQPLFRHIVNQFVHDGSRPQAIAVGLNVIREMCLRIPELMTEDLMQDLAQYRKAKRNEKAVSAASRALVNLFREIWPMLLARKDRGRPVDPNARPKEFGEVNVLNNVADVELLEESEDEESKLSGSGDVEQESDGEIEMIMSDDDTDHSNEGDTEWGEAFGGKRGKKRKTIDCDETSLRRLKRLAETKQEEVYSDGILSNEDFQRIKELKMNKEAKLAMARHGLKIPDSEQLRMKRVDPAKFEAHIKLKLTKEQRLRLVKAGREDRGKYQAKAAIKQRKLGGLSNKQKEQKKRMPLAAKRSKLAKYKQANKRKQSNQFRGRKHGNDI